MTTFLLLLILIVMLGALGWLPVVVRVIAIIAVVVGGGFALLLYWANHPDCSNPSLLQYSQQQICGYDPLASYYKTLREKIDAEPPLLAPAKGKPHTHTKQQQAPPASAH
jgi:hypothetical protein